MKTQSLMRHSMEDNMQMILRNWKRYIDGTVVLHVGKRYRIITADWIVLWGWALGSWWIPKWWFYLKRKKNPQNLKEEDGTNLNIMKCSLFYIHHFFSLDWMKHACFVEPKNLKTKLCTGEKKFPFSK